MYDSNLKLFKYMYKTQFTNVKLSFWHNFDLSLTSVLSFQSTYTRSLIYIGFGYL